MSAPPRLCQIGIDELSPSTPEAVTLNMAKQWREAKAAFGSKYSDHKRASELPDFSDPSGHFKSVPPGAKYVYWLALFENRDESYLGEYEVGFSGSIEEEDVLIDLGADIVPGSWRALSDGALFRINVTACANIMIALRNIRDPNNPPRDPEMVPANDVAWRMRLSTGEVFTPGFVNLNTSLGPALLRDMNAKHTNDSDVVEPEDAPQTDDCTWDQGMPLPAICRLGREAGAMVRFHIPHNASSRYVEWHAQTVAAEFGDRPHQIAYTNEASFNWLFQQTKDHAAASEKAWGDEAVPDWHAKRSTEIALAYKSAWPGDPGNVLPVLEGAQNNVGVCRRLLTAPRWKENEPDRYVDPQAVHIQFDVTGYVGGPIGRKPEEHPWLWGVEGVGGLIETDEEAARVALTRQLIDVELPALEAQWALIRSETGLRLPLGTYEDWDHIDNAKGGERMVRFLTGWRRSSHYADYLSAKIDAYKSSKIKLFTIFSLMGNYHPTKGRDWSLHDNFGDDRPAVRLLRQRLVPEGPWWE